MFKGLGKLATAMRQAQEMSGKMEGVNQKLKAERVTASTGAGMAEVEANGLGEILRVKIDPQLVESGDREMIEDLLPGAINQAIAKAKQLHMEELRLMTDDISLPGLEEALSQFEGGEFPQESLTITWMIFISGHAGHDAMAQLSESVADVIDQFAKLPGIGKKSAERLAYHILRVNKNDALALADAIRHVRENVTYCQKCYNLSEGDVCNICRDPKRDQSVMCVVEQPRDLMSLEQSGVFRGLYHVLLGRIAPLEGIGPEQLTIEALVDRIAASDVREVILATNPTVEGDGTALHISNLLAEYPVEITRLARGITTGSILEYTNKEILADALTGRQKF